MALPNSKKPAMRAGRRDGEIAAYSHRNDMWVYAVPHDVMYSTLLMCATHYWSDEKKIWRDIREMTSAPEVGDR